MKIRTDFITNSSSTSFMIASKEELTKEKLYELFGVPEDHLLHKLLEGIVETIFARLTKTTKETIFKERGKIPEKYAEVIEREEQGYYLYDGYFADDCGAAEAYLCNTDLNIETEDFILKHESGY